MSVSKISISRGILGTFFALVVMIAFQNCGKKDSTVGTLNGGSTDGGSVTTTTLLGGGSSGLTINENFEGMGFSSGCNSVETMPACLGMLGPNNGRALMVRKFAATCEQNRISAWLGGITLYHGSPSGNPGGDNNWAPVRFNVAGYDIDNEALMTRNKQTKVNGSASIEFLSEGTANNMISLVTHATPEEIPGCASSMGIPTYKNNVMVAYYITYFPAGMLGAGSKAGFGVYITNTKGGGSGLVSSSFIEHTMTKHWYRIEFSRNGDYNLNVVKYDAGIWTSVGSKNISATVMKIDGVDMPLGFVGFNSDVQGNVSFDNFKVNW